MSNADSHDGLLNPDGPTAQLVREMLAMGYSQGELSRRSGIGQSRISRWAHGENTSSADDALRLRALRMRLKPRKAKAPAA